MDVTLTNAAYSNTLSLSMNACIVESFRDVERLSMRDVEFEFIGCPKKK